jgi:hypothetical protein
MVQQRAILRAPAHRPHRLAEQFHLCHIYHSESSFLSARLLFEALLRIFCGFESIISILIIYKVKDSNIISILTYKREKI